MYVQTLKFSAPNAENHEISRFKLQLRSKIKKINLGYVC